MRWHFNVRRGPVLSRSRSVLQSAKNVDYRLGAELALEDDIDRFLVSQHGMGTEEEAARLTVASPRIEGDRPHPREPRDLGAFLGKSMVDSVCYRLSARFNFRFWHVTLRGFTLISKRMNKKRMKLTLI